MAKKEWKLVTTYPIESYKCGLKAGDRVKLKHDIIAKDRKGEPTGQVYHAGEVWAVLTGADEEPVVVWLWQADRDRHTWDDDESFFETLEVVRDGAT